MLDEAEKRAQKLGRRFVEPIPIVVNSAGCGSTMKEYGHVAGQRLEALADRVEDISEFLLRQGLRDALARSPGVEAKAVYHHACHLAHGQRVKEPPRQLLEGVPGLELTPLPESDMCCGSAGTYNLFQPAMARRLLDRKWRNIASTGAEMVIQGNPGCHAWIAQAAAEAGGSTGVWHTAEVLESSFSGLPKGD
jgi:glycolate oxidase iron-sulfur subunit